MSSQSRRCKHEGKTATVLTVSSRSLRKHGGNGATPALLNPRFWEMRLREHDCEGQSLFDLTKAMVDPKPNAEFSLSVISACEVCTGELPCSMRLHVSAKVDNMCDFTHSEIDGGAGANVFVFETLPCPVLSKTKMFAKWLHYVFSHNSVLPHSAGDGCLLGKPMLH